jgi:hypothetical protein
MHKYFPSCATGIAVSVLALTGGKGGVICSGIPSVKHITIGPSRERGKSGNRGWRRGPYSRPRQEHATVNRRVGRRCEQRAESDAHGQGMEGGVSSATNAQFALVHKL